MIHKKNEVLYLNISVALIRVEAIQKGKIKRKKEDKKR